MKSAAIGEIWDKVVEAVETVHRYTSLDKNRKALLNDLKEKFATEWASQFKGLEQGKGMRWVVGTKENFPNISWSNIHWRDSKSKQPLNAGTVWAMTYGKEDKYHLVEWLDESSESSLEESLRLSRNEYMNGFERLVEENKKLKEVASELLHLHMCEQEGLSSGQPTRTQWLEAVDKLSEALNSNKG